MLVLTIALPDYYGISRQAAIGILSVLHKAGMEQNGIGH